MANPNIVGVTEIYGKTDGLAVTTTATAIVTNSAASGEVYKINVLFVSNVDGTNDATIVAEWYDASTTTYFHLGSTITVPADSSLVQIEKATGIYLEEGDLIRLTASVDGDLEAIVSYEVIS